MIDVAIFSAIVAVVFGSQYVTKEDRPVDCLYVALWLALVVGAMALSLVLLTAAVVLFG
jgi:hypothetical protein